MLPWAFSNRRSIGFQRVSSNSSWSPTGHLHEDEVADQVGLAQRHARRVEALEDVERVLVLKLGVDELQPLGEQVEEGPQARVGPRAGDRAQPAREVTHGGGDPPLRRRLPGEAGDVLVAVAELGVQPVAVGPLLELVLQRGKADLLGQFVMPASRRRVAKGTQHEREGRQPLLAVDQVVLVDLAGHDGSRGRARGTRGSAARSCPVAATRSGRPRASPTPAGPSGSNAGRPG